MMTDINISNNDSDRKSLQLVVPPCSVESMKSIYLN